MNWIKDFIPNIKKNISQTFGSEKDSKVPEGLWQSCDNCGSILYIPELKKKFICLLKVLISSKNKYPTKNRNYF